MATKKFLIEVEEGMTLCKDCPYKIENAACNCPFRMKVSQCRKYNLATMKIKEYEEDNN